MGMSLKVHPANGTDNGDHGLSAEERDLLDRLVKLWKTDAERGLKTRHATGEELNRQVGPPTERKPHGRKVLEVCGKELGIASSDLNRMGWFSHLFPRYSAFRKQHSEIDSWTKFKEALPSLKLAKGFKARKPAANPSRPAMSGVVRLLEKLTSKLKEPDFRPRKAEKEQIVAAMQELAEAFIRLEISVKVTVGVKDRKPNATTRTSRPA